MNFRRIMLALLAATAVAMAASWQAPAAQAHGSAGDWPPYPGYPAYGGWYHFGHQHHYVYRAHNWQWHPAGWGYLGPYGGWYGGGLPWYGPGNCGVGCSAGALYYDGATSGATTSQGSVHDEPMTGDDDTDDFPGLPELP